MIINIVYFIQYIFKFNIYNIYFSDIKLILLIQILLIRI